MRDYVKLTNHNGNAVYVNTAMILTIEASHSNGSTLKMAMSDRVFNVKESTDEIMKLIKNTIKY
jgi:uncharacterized protein YlzI (FlbEa/FlbD family)